MEGVSSLDSLHPSANAPIPSVTASARQERDALSMIS